LAGAFLTSDLVALMSPSEFGENIGAASYKGVPVVGIFDDDDVEVTMGEGPSMIQHQTVFTGRSADFIGIADGDAMVIRAVSYQVRHWMDDGVGVIEVHLEPVA
jgi:hypothetical protein